jgi:hypothetical protein
MQLDEDTSQDERLRVYQAIRDSGVLPEDAGFYLVSSQIDRIACYDQILAFGKLANRTAPAAKSHGLKKGKLRPSPETVRECREELGRRFQRILDEVFIEKLEAYGEHAIAEQCRSDPEKFCRRKRAGREYFHGAVDPDVWVPEIAEAVAKKSMCVKEPGTLGFRYTEGDGAWIIDLYPKPVELVGGADDGRIVFPGCNMDLEGLRSLFERVDELSFQTPGCTCPAGPHISINGVYQGQEVFLRVLGYVPEDEEPRRKKGMTRRKP